MVSKACLLYIPPMVPWWQLSTSPFSLVIDLFTHYPYSSICNQWYLCGIDNIGNTTYYPFSSIWKQQYQLSDELKQPHTTLCQCYWSKIQCGVMSIDCLFIILLLIIVHIFFLSIQKQRFNQSFRQIGSLESVERTCLCMRKRNCLTPRYLQRC